MRIECAAPQVARDRLRNSGRVLHDKIAGELPLWSNEPDYNRDWSLQPIAGVKAIPYASCCMNVSVLPLRWHVVDEYAGLWPGQIHSPPEAWPTVLNVRLTYPVLIKAFGRHQSASTAKVAGSAEFSEDKRASGMVYRMVQTPANGYSREGVVLQ
ncbi:hypothetical protein BA177_06100 [Woeseia oceani]|uniref:Uncharacterized protein n=1 Tax=Woeseia oceani TaxID=1548547 RepID=A0A193LEM6_9GAMM|nr:hypothetical protein BA177_06100 [Woeseia oceani]